MAVYAGLTFCYSALAAVLPALSTDLFGLPHAGVNYGFLALGQSVGSLSVPLHANLWGLEAGRHLLAMAVQRRVLQPFGRCIRCGKTCAETRRKERAAKSLPVLGRIDKNLTIVLT